MSKTERPMFFLEHVPIELIGPEDPDTQDILHAKVRMFDADFCVVFIRVQERRDIYGKRIHFCHADKLDHLSVLRRYTGQTHWHTFELFGLDGNWVMLITPFGDIEEGMVNGS